MVTRSVNFYPEWKIGEKKNLVLIAGLAIAGLVDGRSDETVPFSSDQLKTAAAP